MLLLSSQLEWRISKTSIRGHKVCMTRRPDWFPSLIHNAMWADCAEGVLCYVPMSLRSSILWIHHICSVERDEIIKKKTQWGCYSVNEGVWALSMSMNFDKTDDTRHNWIKAWYLKKTIKIIYWFQYGCKKFNKLLYWWKDKPDIKSAFACKLHIYLYSLLSKQLHPKL